MTFLTRSFDGEVGGRSPDELVVEEPLQIRLDDALVATTMRTPGHDFELAAGWCHSEGLLSGASVETVRYCATGSAVDTQFNVVSVSTGGRAPVPRERLGTASSSCGLCGSDAIDELIDRIAPSASTTTFAPHVLAALPAAMRAQQPLFAATGAVHAAAAFDHDGQVVVVREDIGRHNAVDKVVGRLLLDGHLPAGEMALAVSGRASFEMVQKAWGAGFAALVAVSAPSALAVEAARRAGMTLAGFARDGAMRIYAGDGVER
ncbi:MAG: formate dehydrogenase accessory sulfurtransferase FdhD [Acidimicrobiia bacterium]|nr:formate dehydrogenase accessory sulfurtransferase FdhD [Acidimicrobiia bacterium]